MTDLSRDILENWQIRKTRKQKTAFIEYLCRAFPQAVVEEGGGSRNIVIGDVEQAELVLTAHYDTCAVLPLPNVTFPQHALLSFLYAIVFVIPMVVVASLLGAAAGAAAKSFWLGDAVYLLTMLVMLAWMFLGKPNRHTVNDNTSGVVTLVELLHQMTEEERQRVAVVFFDNEENGLLGSGQFKKRHKDTMRHKLLLNFDCVSDGDTIALVCGKGVAEETVQQLCRAFTGSGDKRLLAGRAGKLFYPSDQRNFPCGVGVAALRGKKLLHLSRIHTKRDTVFDEENIRLLCRSVDRLLKTEKSI